MTGHRVLIADDDDLMRAGEEWTAIVDHRGRSGQSVSLRVELTGADGAAVTQTVRDAYTVR